MYNNAFLNATTQVGKMCFLSIELATHFHALRSSVLCMHLVCNQNESEICTFSRFTVIDLHTTSMQHARSVFLVFITSSGIKRC